MKLGMTLKSMLVTVTAAVALTGFAQAQEVNHRLHNQNERISQGVKKGELTGRQAARLRAHDREIHARERHDRMMQHGKLTARERRRLNGSLNKNSKQIYRDKHDAAAHGN